jgi:hypothetical protein
MHYDDETVLKAGTLEVVIYKHNDCDGGYELDLCSIQDCAYIRPYDLQQFLARWDLYYDEQLREIEPETFYSFHFKINSSGYGMPEFVSFEKVDDSTFSRLH